MPRAKKSDTTVPKSGAEMDPTWYSLYRVMAATGDRLLESLVARKDIPLDAIKILQAVLCLRESKDLFFAEGGRLTPSSALLWVEELQKWVAEVEKEQGFQLDEAQPSELPRSDS